MDDVVLESLPNEFLPTFEMMRLGIMSSLQRPMIAVRAVLTMAALFVAGQPAVADETFAQRIDRLLAESNPGLAVPVSADFEFLRRISLDLVGRVPSVQEARDFAANADPNKRAALIDRLLASPEFSRHFSNVLNVMFNERRPDKGIPAAEWQAYLFESVQQNKHFDQLAREILAADGADPALRPAAKFYLDREGEPNLVTRDVGRIFFGMDLQCAQCHDHPLIEDYYQTEYYGLYAFLSRGFVFIDKKDKDKPYFAEKAEGDVSFLSVFTKKPGLTDPRLPTGTIVADTAVKFGEEYLVAPAEGVRPVPRYSRRSQLAARATDGTNRAFNRNIANRLWAYLMGRGLVEPLDLHHGANPPSNPQVLEALTDEVVRQKFDVRAILRELATTKAYQGSYDATLDVNVLAEMSARRSDVLRKEVQALKDAAAQSGKQIDETCVARDAAIALVSPIVEEMNKANVALTAGRQAADKAAKALADANANLVAKQELLKVVQVAVVANQEVAKKLPDDKELAAVAEAFVAREKKVTDEIAAVTKSVGDLTPPAKAAADAIEPLRTAVAAVTVRLEPVKQQFEVALNNWHAATEKARLDKLALRAVEAQLADMDQIAKFQTSEQQVASHRKAVETIRTDVVHSETAIQAIAAALPNLQTATTDAQSQQDQATRRLAEAKQQLSAQQEIVKSISDAVMAVEAVSAKLPGDVEFMKIAQTIKARADQLSLQMVEFKKPVEAAEQEVKVATDKMNAAQAALSGKIGESETLKQKVSALQAEIQDNELKADKALSEIPVLQQGVMDRLAQRFYVSNLRPLSPEQVAWSVMQVSGVLENYQKAVNLELDKTIPLDAAALADPVKVSLRAKQLEAGVFEKLKANADVFIRLFSAGAGQPQDFFSTVDQALFFSNGGTIVSWLAPADGNLTGRLLKIDDPAGVAEELYLGILCRPPNEAEKNEVKEFLAKRAAEKPAAVVELAWGLISSAEFRFNH